VIDGQPLVRLGVRELLAGHYDVEEAESHEEALDLAKVEDFDVAIVDMRAPTRRSRRRLGGTATIRALLKARPGLGIVAHGERAERDLANEAMRAGAKAYVVKSSASECLTEAVEAAAESETFIDPAVAPARRGRRGPGLTKRQRQVLQLLADGQPTAQIAKRLGLSPETVKTHTRNLLARLKARDRAHAVAIALRNSLID
jgi:two-component system, NarL family, response regulator